MEPSEHRMPESERPAPRIKTAQETTVEHAIEEGPADRIFNAMQNAIEHLKPGTKLPSEREMMERNDISRQTARVVLNRLMREGLVERKIGSGTFVRERYRPEEGLPDPREVDAGLADVFEARRGLDPLVIELAIERASPREIDKLEAILQELIATQDQCEMKRIAYNFQLALAVATRNPILQASYEILVQCRANLGWDHFRWHEDEQSTREGFIQRQTELFEAIKRRDRFAAVTFVLRDLDRLQSLAMGPRLQHRTPPSDTETGVL